MWSPQPTLGGQSWSGNPPVVTSRQLVSSISSVQVTLSSIEAQVSTLIGGDVSSVNQSTGTVSSLQTSKLWNANSILVSTPTLITNALSSQSVLTSSITGGSATMSTMTLSSIFAVSNSAGTTNTNTVSTTTVNATTVNASNLNGTVSGAVNATSLNVTGAIDFNNNSVRQFSGGYTSTSGIALNSYYNVQAKASTNITLLVDRGADVGGNATIDLVAQYGAATRINLNAKAGSAFAPIPTAQVNINADGNTTLAPSLAPIGGAVNITAGAGYGSGTAVIGYGQITLQANSFNTTTQPGFIKMTAGSNALYAGTASPVIGTYGQNYVWGQLGNSFVASTTPPTLPALLQTNYFYGGLGDVGGHSAQITGNNMVGGLGVDFIQPKTLYGDLYIQGTAAGADGVQISSCKVLNMSTSGAITGVGNLSASTINADTVNLTHVLATDANISSIVVTTLTNNSSIFVSTNRNIFMYPTGGFNVIGAANYVSTTANYQYTTDTMAVYVRGGSNTTGLLNIIASTCGITADNLTLASNTASTNIYGLTALTLNSNTVTTNGNMDMANHDVLNVASSIGNTLNYQVSNISSITTSTIIAPTSLFISTGNQIELRSPSVLLQTPGNRSILSILDAGTQLGSQSTIYITAPRVEFQGSTTNISSANISTLKVASGSISTLNVSSLFAGTAVISSIIETIVSTTNAVFQNVNTSTLTVSQQANINTANTTTLSSGTANITNLSTTTGAFKNINTSTITISDTGQAKTFYVSTLYASTFIGDMSGDLDTLNVNTISAGKAFINTLSTNNITGSPNLSISTNTFNLQTTQNSPVTSTIVYVYTGSPQTFVAPAGVTSIQVSVYGAGGGTNTTGAYSQPGAGGLAGGTLNVVPGNSYTILVGQGGGSLPSAGRYGGGGAGGAGTASCDGGGYSAILLGSNPLVMAGGGGGAAQISSTGNNNGGGGGGNAGITGSGVDMGVSPYVYTGGEGAVQTGVGVGGGGNNPGQPGSTNTGGRPATGCGAGGGGLFGGGGGGFNAPSSDSYGGGGGGSGYVSALVGSVVNTPGGGSPATRDGKVIITYLTGAQNPTVNLDAFVDIQNSLTFAGKSIVSWTQTLSNSQSHSQNAYDSQFQNAVYPPTGGTFSSADYVMTIAMLNASINQPWAISYAQVSQQVSGSTWQIRGQLGTATAGVEGQNLTANWTVAITMTPLELCPGGAVHALPPIPSTLNIAANLPWVSMSSITASTLTFLAGENISLNAKTAIPTFIGQGSIGINASTNIDIMANYDINLGAHHNIVIASNNNVEISAPSTNYITIVNQPRNGYESIIELQPTGNIFQRARGDFDFQTAHRIYLTATTSIELNSGYFNIFCDTYFNNHNIRDVKTVYFYNSGNINSYQSGGVNFLDINTPATTGSGTGQLRLLGNKGSLVFEDNIALAGTGSNYNGLYNGDGYIRLNNYQNVELKGAGGHLGGEDQIIVHGLIYSDSRIYTGTSGQGFLHQNGSGFIQTRVDYGAYGGLTMNGYLQVCQTGTTSSIFTVPSDTNGSMWYNNGTGGFGIGTTTPAYKLDVNGTTRTTLGIVYGASDVARLILGATPGAGNYDYCSLIQSQSNVASNYGSQLSFWTHPNAGNYGDPVQRMTIDQTGNVIIATGSLYMSGNTIEMGGTSTNTAYISGLNHIYGNPTSASGYFGGMIIDYMGGQFYNGGGNDAGIYVPASTHALVMYNINADILIDSHTHGINLYGAGMNVNLPTTLQGSSYLDLNSKTVYGAKQIGFFYGGTLTTVIPGGHTDADINLSGTGGDSAITLTNGTSEIQMNANNDLVITPATGKNILLNGAVTTVLSSTAIRQPVIQYGETTGSGTSGSATVTLPVPYTSSTSYVVFASMMDTTECKISVNRDSDSQITIYWSQGGAGSHKLGWNTMGT